MDIKKVGYEYENTYAKYFGKIRAKIFIAMKLIITLGWKYHLER